MERGAASRTLSAMATVRQPTLRQAHPWALRLVLAALLAAALGIGLWQAFAGGSTGGGTPPALRAEVAGVYRQVVTGETLTLRADGSFDFDDLVGEARMPAWHAATHWSGKPARRDGDVLVRVPSAAVEGTVTRWYSFLLRGGRLYSVSGANGWQPAATDMYVLRKRL
jgi:hypothetical protein